MNNKKHSGVYLLTSCIGLGALILIYNDFICSGAKCYNLEVSLLEPSFYILLGLIPTSLSLLFFPEKIFILWMKHIAWWFLIFTFLMVGNTSQGGFLPMYDKAQVALFWMAVLFVITVIYALIMNRKLKGSS